MKSILYIAFVFILWSCSSTSHEEAVETEQDHSYTAEQLNASGITFSKLTPRVVEKSINCNGIIDVPPQNKSEVVAPLGGIVSAIHVYPTEAVKKGQVLCEITGQQYLQLQQRYLSAKAQMEFTQDDFERKSSMFENEATSQKEFQQAKNQMNQAKSEYLGARSELIFCGLSPDQIEKSGIQQKLIVRSPINGYITNVNVTQGMAVDAQMGLIQLINKEHMHLELTVFEKDIAQLALHQPIRFSLEGDTSIHRGEIFLIGQALNGQNKSINVHGHLERENSKFKPGMYVNANIVTQSDTVLALPKKSAIAVGSGYQVYVKQADGEIIPELFRVAYETSEYLVPADIEKWKSKSIALEGVYQLQEAEAGHSH